MEHYLSECHPTTGTGSTEYGSKNFLSISLPHKIIPISIGNKEITYVVQLRGPKALFACNIDDKKCAISFAFL